MDRSQTASPRSAGASPRSGDPLGAIARAVVVPVVREDGAARSLEVARWLLGEGLEVVELTASSPGWEHAACTLRAEAPGVTLGVGTLRTAEAAELAVACEADFLVTPHPAPAVRALAEAAGVPLIEGGFSPGEVLAAADRGVAKLFPAHVGGPALLRSILALEPVARIVPTGGVRLQDVPAWLDAGAYAVGVGSELRPSPAVAASLRETLAAVGERSAA